jgi:hypothetical protein
MVFLIKTNKEIIIISIAIKLVAIIEYVNLEKNLLSGVQSFFKASITLEKLSVGINSLIYFGVTQLFTK